MKCCIESDDEGKDKVQCYVSKKIFYLMGAVGLLVSQEHITQKPTSTTRALMILTVTSMLC